MADICAARAYPVHSNLCGERSIILKTHNKWLGWDPELRDYMVEPIEFRGELNFENTFSELILNDPISKSCNIIKSM